VIGDVSFVSGLVQQDRDSVGTSSAMST